MARILVTEQLAPRGLSLMREAGHAVDERLGLAPEELVEAVKGAQALVIRSATKVTADVLLDEARVAIVPGEAFGAPGFARLSYALSDEDLEEGVTRIAKVLGE